MTFCTSYTGRFCAIWQKRLPRSACGTSGYAAARGCAVARRSGDGHSAQISAGKFAAVFGRPRTGETALRSRLCAPRTKNRPVFRHAGRCNRWRKRCRLPACHSCGGRQRGGVCHAPAAARSIHSAQKSVLYFVTYGGAISGENGVGCRPVTPVVVTNAEEYAAFRLLRTGKTAHGADVLRVE